MSDSVCPLKEAQVLTGPLFSEPMRVETVRESGNDAWTVGLVGTQTERFRKVTLSAHDQGVSILEPGFRYDGDGRLLRLGLQAYSLGIAWEFDPYFGLSISRVDPLPHQLEAVYDYLLKLARVRFLLADDAGAGKTIMAGLLTRELRMCGLAERILIVGPANLAFQWQRELKEKFDEKFLVLKGSDLRDQFGVNQWLQQKRTITSLDLAKREDILPGLRQVHWDLVIVDEAHLVFACIGPALEIFSRYRAVETAEGREVGLPEYLEKVWEVVGHAALKQVLGTSAAAAGALEEDARLTALFLWTLQSTEAQNGDGKKKAAAKETAEDDEEAVAKLAAKGLSLPFDMVRRFAQPMGIDLDVWTDRIIGRDKGVVRLLPVAERAKALFGEDGTGAAADWIESDTGGDLQAVLFPEMGAAPKKKTRGRGKTAILSGDAELHSPDATTLDRVHAAMLLQSSGQANALRTLIGAEQDRGPDFLRLANALSALYTRGSEEKRLLDAMLLAVPR